MNLRLAASLITLSALAVPAMAGAQESSSASSASSSSASSLYEPELPNISSCLQSTNKDKCIPDGLKILDRAIREFVNIQERKRAQWVKDHTYMGATTDYRILLQAYSEQLKKEGDVFFDKIDALRKQLTAGRTNPRGRGNASSSSSSLPSRLRTNVDAEALAKCANVKDEQRYRVCVRGMANRGKLKNLEAGKTYRR
jgi:hypothetical protein